MDRIVAPIRPQDKGPAVANFQQAMLFIVEKRQLTPANRTLVSWNDSLSGEIANQLFGQGTLQLLLALLPALHLPGADFVTPPVADALNNVLQDLGAFTPPPPPPPPDDPTLKFTVDGKVFSASRAGVGQLPVQILDKNVSNDIVVAETTTDTGGSYQVDFTIADLHARGKERADLQARVFLGETSLGASDVRYNASNHETLNVLLPETAASSLPSEHETLTEAIATHFQGNLGDLQETDGRQDITYLANKTGWDARAVALAALADQFSSRTADASGAPAIPSVFFYALFRAGLPANEDTLYHTDAKTLEGVWTGAVAQGVIPKTSADQIPNMIGRFQALSAQKLLTGPALVGASSFKEMLAVSGLNDAQQATFAQLYAANSTDMPTFWKAVSDAFGQNTATRLQMDGKLGFLTINNAPLMQKVQSTAGTNGLSDPLQLTQMGYHRAEPWSQLLTENVPIPEEIPGDTPESKRANYSDYLAAQVRLSYPTAAVAQMVKSGELPLTGAANGVSDQVHAFLTEHQGEFEIGVQPIQQYVADNKVQVADEVVQQVKRLQRVYQITPSDQALTGLMKRGIDAAYHVVRYDRDTFAQSFAEDLGGADQAALTYDRSVQIHNAVLNIVLSYLNARTAPAIGVHSPTGILDPTPANPGDIIPYATLESLFGSMDFCACDHCRSILSPAAYLVDLLLFLGSDADVWADTLKTWKQNHQNAPYPFVDPNAWQNFQNDWNNQHPSQPLPNTEISPFDVLMSRRPDIQHLPLTCENTNTALPYIDVVNETLEYYIANGLTLEKNTLVEYPGHDTNDVASEDLLANPQFVMDSAYTTLRNERFPAPLPFHQPLENLRRYFNKFQVPLPLAMERLRKTDDLERGANPYGWRDILMEEIGLSRAEYEILTDSNAVPLWQMYGFPNGTADADVIAGLSNAKQFARRVGITYEDLVSILKTRFINPNSDLIPKLERLGVSFAMLAELKTKNDATTDDKFDALLAALAVPPDPAEYGGDPDAPKNDYTPIRAWVKDNDNYARIMGLVTLAIPAATWTGSHAYAIGDCVVPTAPEAGSTLYYECTTAGTSAPPGSEPKWPTTPADPPVQDGTVKWTYRDASNCSSFDNLAFRYSDPAKSAQNIGAVEFVRLLRFIRLWKKLGWTIDQTDVTICALYRADLAPLDANDIDDVTKLDTGFLTVLPRLGIVSRVIKALNLTPDRDLLSLLACFAQIGIQDGVIWVSDSEGGRQQQVVPSLYRQMFLNPAMLNQDAVFADNGYGEFLQDSSQTLFATNSTKKAKLAGRITIGDVLSTSINGLPIPYTVVAGDSSITTLATNIVSTINATTAADPITGSPLNEVVVASNASGVITITMKNPKPDSSISLSCSVSDGATETYAPVDHQSALCAAFNLTGSEFNLITDALKFDATTPLSLANISAIYRRGWLARKLKLSVRELLLLIQLTGLDPFAAPDPINPAILRLISLVQALKDRSFKSAAALYLIWNQDLSGKSAPDWAQVAGFARTLRLGLGAVETEFAVADDPDGAITQTRLTMVYGSDAASFFFGLLNDTLSVEVEFSDPDGTLAAGPLRQAIESAAGRTDAGIPKIAYDDFRKRFSYSGVLTTAIRDAIKLAAGAGAAAFKTAVDNLYSKNQAVISPFFARYPELQSPYGAYVSDTSHSVSEKRDILLKAILPDLVKRQKRQQTLQAVSATANTNSGFAQTLLDPPTAPFPIHAAGHADQPAMNGFLALETSGLSVEFFANDSAIGSIIPSPDIAFDLDYAPLVGAVGNPLPANPTPGAAVSGVWRGYLEAPESGFFNLSIEADAGANVTLILDGKPVTLVQSATLWNNTDPIELRAGTLYSINLTVEKVRNFVRVQWDWEPKGQGRAVIPARYLYPAVPFEAFKEAYVRFLKAASLATGLGLTANELAFLATYSDYQIGGDGWLNALAVSGDPAPATAAALLRPFVALLDFARIKSDISPSDESLLTALQDPTAATQNTDSLLFTITRWNQTSLNDVLTQFSDSIAGVAHFDLFCRAYDAFALIQKMGISAKALIQATTNEPTGDTVRDLQAALRARYDAASWRDVVRPINDDMRSLQRDALVAYILHQMLSHPESAHIDTPDKLFEYFLMDVQMDPCMLTSRIRHALSSVQLFIERCLMNLEPRVSPAAINAQQWEWMKRYRVWEANRKVYLFPENWLEPELRDDKSPFFKEVESELLQSDITDDSATTALLNYLSKLEEVAKLEPCGIYYDEEKKIDHVVARTAANRKYYYRRYEYGYWTPWEQIKLEIEDNPVIPVVWNDRLMLFWLRILKKGPDTTKKLPPQKRIGDLTTDDLPDDPEMNVQAVLCWSEYYNGKWQATKTSDVNNPLELGSFSPLAFDRSTLWLRSDEPGDDQLRINIYGNVTPQAFVLYNTHSLPLPSTPAAFPPPVGKVRVFETATLTFRIDYDDNISNIPDNLLRRDVLTENIDMGTGAVQPSHDVSDIWDAPFFFEDRRSVSYVTTQEQRTWVINSGGYGVPANSGVMKVPHIPPLVLQPEPPIPQKFWGDGGPIGPDLGAINSAPMQRFVTEDAYIRQGIGTTGVVTYGDQQIGPSGAITNLQAGM